MIENHKISFQALNAVKIFENKKQIMKHTKKSSTIYVLFFVLICTGIHAQKFDIDEFHIPDGLNLTDSEYEELENIGRQLREKLVANLQARGYDVISPRKSKIRLERVGIDDIKIDYDLTADRVIFGKLLATSKYITVSAYLYGSEYGIRTSHEPLLRTIINRKLHELDAPEEINATVSEIIAGLFLNKPQSPEPTPIPTPQSTPKPTPQPTRPESPKSSYPRGKKLKRFLKSIFSSSVDPLDNLDFKEFTLPAPKSSRSRRKPFSINEVFSNPCTFGDIDKELSEKLLEAGFKDKNNDKRFYYFQLKSKKNGKFKGFAVVTQFEQIEKNGEPINDRFNETVGKKELASLRFLERLLPPLNQGYFRCFAFLIVQDYHGGESNENLTKIEAAEEYEGGEKELPDIIAAQPVKSGCELRVLIYEYEQREDKKDGTLLKKGLKEVSFEQHLEKAFIRF